MHLRKIFGLGDCVYKFGLLNSDILTDIVLDEVVVLCCSALFKASLCAFYLHCSLCGIGRGWGSDDVLRQAKHYFLSMLIDYFIYLNECVCTPLIVRNL